MEPMKPDAVNAGVPKHSVGDIAAWTHDVHLEKYSFVFSEVLIKEVKFTDDNNWYYDLVVLASGSEFSCSEKNLRAIDEAKETYNQWLKF